MPKGNTEVRKETGFWEDLFADGAPLGRTLDQIAEHDTIMREAALALIAEEAIAEAELRRSSQHSRENSDTQ